MYITDNTGQIGQISCSNGTKRHTCPNVDFKKDTSNITTSVAFDSPHGGYIQMNLESWSDGKCVPGGGECATK